MSTSRRSLPPVVASSPAGLPLPLQRCVEGYVFVRGPARFLLLKRAPSRGGWWQSVSGRLDPADRSLVDGVLREVREETGFEAVSSVLDLGWSTLFYPRAGGRPWVLHAFGIELPRLLPPRLSHEHTVFRWCRYPEAQATLYWEDNREALRRLALHHVLGGA